jgi:NhaC family Na+:H+ antiporter
MSDKRTLDAILSVFFVIGGVSLAGIFGIPLFIGFSFSLFLMILLLLKRGIGFKEILDASILGLKRIKPVVYILFLIATLIPVWISSGTIPAMIQLGITWIDPRWIVVMAFILSATISFLLGTSIGTLGSFGVVMISVAISANASVPAVAGALVSGALFGDRISPLSSMFQLVANSVEESPNKLFKKLALSTVLITGFCIIFYLILGMFQTPETLEVNNNYNTLLEQSYHISLISFIPLFVVFGSILVKTNTIKSLALGVVTGGIIAIFHEQVVIQELVMNMIKGFVSSNENLAQILKGGGILGMIEPIIFISLSGMMNGLLDRTKLFQPLIDKLFQGVKSMTNYTIRTVLLTLMLAVVGSNQALPALIAGRSLSGSWVKGGFEKGDLGRVICDSSVVTSGIIPWNMVAILSAAAIGVSTLDYALFAVLLWISPVVTIITSYMMSRKRAVSQTVSS